MQRPVFISYARRASATHAEALHRALNGAAFLDTTDIEAGEQFPRILIDALFAAKAVVIFAEEVYFERWYCLRELRTALAPYDLALRRPGVSQEQIEAALHHIILALPADSAH